jgi:hypothetical protein
MNAINNFFAIQTYYENLSQYKIGSNLSFCAIIQKNLYPEKIRYSIQHIICTNVKKPKLY